MSAKVPSLVGEEAVGAVVSDVEITVAVVIIVADSTADAPTADADAGLWRYRRCHRLGYGQGVARVSRRWRRQHVPRQINVAWAVKAQTTVDDVKVEKTTLSKSKAAPDPVVSKIVRALLLPCVAEGQARRQVASVK